MKLVVTGGSGALGRQVVQDAVDRGHQVLSLDRAPAANAICPAWVADLTDPGDLYQALQGAGGVIHLAAYQAPNLAPDTETFGNNVRATYNVLKAATDCGTQHIVLASSVAAYGFLYAPKMSHPAYLPLNENHPCTPQDPYGLSKVFGEQLADSFAGLGASTIASLRLPGINFDLTYERMRARWSEPELRLGNFWSYIDVRDASAACLQALEAAYVGHEVFNVAAPTSSMRDATEELVRRYLPGVATKKGLTGNWSGMDSSKAERMLGFQARHRWEDHLDEAPSS
jgi:nucleoside-diphosphate-sugar epimerase